jgi:hypothetical protein
MLAEEIEACPSCKKQFGYNGNDPKILPCCTNLLCVKCIDTFYKKKNTCPFCQQILSTRPIDLLTCELPVKYPCPTCKIITSSKNLTIELTADSNPKIKCCSCSPSDINLHFYITQIIKEMETYRFVVFDYTAETYSKMLNDSISTFFNDFLNQTKENLTEKIKNSLMNFLHKDYNISNDTFIHFSNLCKLYDKLKLVKQIKPSNYQEILEGLTLYSKHFYNAMCQGGYLLNFEKNLKENKLLSTINNSDDMGKVIECCISSMIDKENIKQHKIKKVSEMMKVINTEMINEKFGIDEIFNDKINILSDKNEINNEKYGLIIQENTNLRDENEGLKNMLRKMEKELNYFKSKHNILLNQKDTSNGKPLFINLDVKEGKSIIAGKIFVNQDTPSGEVTYKSNKTQL